MCHGMYEGVQEVISREHEGTSEMFALLFQYNISMVLQERVNGSEFPR